MQPHKKFYYNKKESSQLMSQNIRLVQDHMQSKQLCLNGVPDKDKKTAYITVSRSFSGDSDRIQTCNLLIRSQVLYSVKLRSLA